MRWKPWTLAALGAAGVVTGLLSLMACSLFSPFGDPFGSPPMFGGFNAPSEGPEAAHAPEYATAAPGPAHTERARHSEAGHPTSEVTPPHLLPNVRYEANSSGGRVTPQGGYWWADTRSRESRPATARNLAVTRIPHGAAMHQCGSWCPLRARSQPQPQPQPRRLVK